MSPQSEGLPSTDRRVGDGAYGTRGIPRQQHYDSANQQTGANGYASSDLPQQFQGLNVKDEQNTNGNLPPSPLDGREGRDRKRENTFVRERSRTNGHSEAHSSGTLRICTKCGEPLLGQFVRALDGMFHLQCFKCRVSTIPSPNPKLGLILFLQDCSQIVASKFFPVDNEDGIGQYPLCEIDYFRRLDLLCFQCGGALRGSYITAVERKYHIEHFTCSVCPTVFGAQDSYYEHEGNIYCHYHYSTQFAQRCNGCRTAILKQFVEIFRNGENQHWHPECYMIHKFWNVRLGPPGGGQNEQLVLEDNATEEKRTRIREEEEHMEEKVYRIWSTLSTFEESSAACISNMLLHVSQGAYVEGVLVAKQFIWHVDILFGATDRLDFLMASDGMKGMIS